MKQVRLLASGLFYFTRIIALAYLATALHCILSFVFRTAYIGEINGQVRFKIFFPFTQTPFLLGDEYSFFYIFELIAFMTLYGIFFWTLGNIFKTFRAEKLLTPLGVKRLKVFYILNFSVPVLFLIMHLALSYEVSTLIILTGLHAVVGVFAYFMAAIFRQGLKLQTEHDLIF